MNLNLNWISPYVRLATKSYLCAPFKIGQRIIFDYEVILLESGKWLMTLEGKPYVCKPDDVILIRPGQTHSLESIDGISVSQPHIHFDTTYDEHSEEVYISFKDLPQFDARERSWIREDIFAEDDIGPFLQLSDLEAFKKIFYSVIARFSEKDRLYTLSCKAEMIQLLQMIIGDHMTIPPLKKQPDTIPFLIQQFIDNNYRNVITLDFLEKQFHYNKFYISRTFEKYTGVSVIRYYNEKRAACAKELLRNGAAVTAVCRELNFSSIYTFSRFFKTMVHCSPTEYKLQK